MLWLVDKGRTSENGSSLPCSFKQGGKMLDQIGMAELLDPGEGALVYIQLTRQQ